MAGESCSLTCNVKDRNNKVVVSALWNDLSKFFKGDRREAVTHYFLTKDSNFLRENSDVLQFDINGEVTFESLKKALERDGEYSNLSNKKLLKHLNEEVEKELKHKNVSYSEALDNVLRFNRSNQFREGFMATLHKEEDGKYSVRVIERNVNSEYELADQVQNKLMTDAVRTLLENQGLSVEFLDKPGYAVMYSTDNAHLDANGLMAVAKVLDGQNSAPEVAEAAGHFIIAAMQGQPLADRLMATLTTDVQNALFKDTKSELYREDFIVSDKSAQEAAGILLGRELLKPFREAQKAPIAKLTAGTVKAVKWLVKKLGNLAKRLLGIYKPDMVQKMVQQAKEQAATAALGYLSNPSQADVSLALTDTNTFKAGSTSKNLTEEIGRNVKAYRETLDTLKNTVTEMRGFLSRTETPINRDIFKKLNLIAKGVDTSYGPSMSVKSFADNASIEGIVVMLEGVTQILDNDLRALLDEINTSDRADSMANYARNARNMRTASAVVKNIAQLYQLLSNKLDSLSSDVLINYEDADNNRVSETLNQAVKRLGDVLVGNEEVYLDTSGKEQAVHGLAHLMMLKRRQVFMDAMRDFFGKDYIERNAGVIWLQKGWKSKLIRSDRIENYQKKNISDLIETLEEDISWFDRYLSSAADCGDFVTAIGNKVIKQANMEADRLASRYWDRLEELRLQMLDVFSHNDFIPLLEVMDNAEGGKTRTGNFVSQVNYGAWENERYKYAQFLKQRWNDHLVELRQEAYKNAAARGDKNYVFNPTDEQLSILRHELVDDLWKQWHNEHSDEQRTVHGGKRYVPKATKYHNQQWDELFDTENPSLSEEEKAVRRKRLKWYNAFMELKDEMDSLLPKGAAVRWRAPQLTGRFSHRFRNLRSQMGDGNTLAAFGHAARMGAQNWLTVQPDEAWMFGSNNEFNEIEEDPLENEIFFEKDKVNRLPMYGINKLKEMNNLSLDIFGTMMSYGSMAATYKAMESVVDVFELGRDVMLERDKQWQSENRKHGESRAYARYGKFMEKQLYGINVEVPSWDRKGTWRKLANNLSSIGGRILLWGNVHGGIVNTGTGMFEIFKEAVAGENFNLNEIGQAHKMYFSGIMDTMGLGLIDAQRPTDKNALWIRHWNILSENRSFLHGQRFDNKAMSLLDNRLWEWFGHTMMLPYSSGDHYMQTIPYYAMGIHQKVYDHDGNEMRLIDAYEEVEGEEVFAIEHGVFDEAIGRTPKKLRLKDGIFASIDDIDNYDKATSMLNKITDYFNNNPGVRGSTAWAPTMLSEEEIELLREERLKIPETVKELESLRAALVSKQSSFMFNETNESEFMDKCRNICNRLHGIYNSEDKVAFQQNFYGNLVMAMRGYALGMVNRRFANNRYNVPQGKNVEGSYNTFSKVMLSAFFNINDLDNWRAVFESLLLTVPVVNLYALFNEKYGNRVKADMQKAGFSEHQYYNMRRTGADFLVLETLALMNLLAAPGRHFGLSDDEDEDKNNKVDTDENFWWGLLYYFTMRWYNEQNAFASVGGMWTEATSLLDYVPVGLSGSKAIFDIAKLFADTQIDKIGEPDYENSDLYYQQSKEGKYEIGDEKWWIKFQRLCPYWRSYYAMSRPYDAASSYEYGRRVRGK